MYGCVHTRSTMAFMWISEDNLQESVLPFHYADLRDGTQVIMLSSKHLYPLSHLSSPKCSRFPPTWQVRGRQHQVERLVVTEASGCCWPLALPCPRVSLQLGERERKIVEGQAHDQLDRLTCFLLAFKIE